MSSIQEIEAAIERLPESQIDELARWIEVFRSRKGQTRSFDEWIKDARGAAKPGVTTDSIMRMTRGEE